MNHWINLQGQSVNKNPGKKLLSQVGNMGKKKIFGGGGIVWKWLKDGIE